MKHPEVKSLAFEPNELLEICERIDIRRYQNNKFFNETIKRFKGHTDKYYGFKIALNPGIEGMRWKNFKDKFPEGKFVFIQRNPEKTYKSWCRIETSKRGLCSYEIYLPWWQHINSSFDKHTKDNPDKATLIKYENLLEDANKEMKKVWDLLGVEKIKGLNQFIKQPTTK